MDLVGIRRVNEREQRPVVFYLHPWEVDPGQPRIEAGWLSRLRHYRNLHQTAPRLRRLLSEFCVRPVREVFAGVLDHSRMVDISRVVPIVDLRTEGRAS